jgi:DNA-binding XRE family transcriptional regulator
MKEARDPDAIRSAMAARVGLTPRELALLAGCSRPTVFAILAGKRCSPTVARRIASVLRLPVDRIFQVPVSSGAQPIDQPSAVA